MQVGASPYSVAAADLNGDGKLDLAVANRDSDNVSVLLNQGNGTFAAKVEYAAGTSPYSVAAADLNGDGKPDLAIANAGSNNVSVLLNQGNGTFAAKVDYAAGTNPNSVAVADLNGDGKPELAITNSSSSNVSILVNQGNGTFAAKVDYGAGTLPTSIVAADLDGDGKPDCIGKSETHCGYMLLRYEREGDTIRLYEADHARVAAAIRKGSIRGHSQHHAGGQPGSAGTVDNFVAGDPARIARVLRKHPELF